MSRPEPAPTYRTMRSFIEDITHLLRLWHIDLEDSDGIPLSGIHGGASVANVGCQCPDVVLIKNFILGTTSRHSFHERVPALASSASTSHNTLVIYPWATFPAAALE